MNKFLIKDFELENIFTANQNLLSDHTSCGYYVVKYITEQVKSHIATEYNNEDYLFLEKEDKFTASFNLDITNVMDNQSVMDALIELSNDPSTKPMIDFIVNSHNSILAKVGILYIRPENDPSELTDLHSDIVNFFKQTNYDQYNLNKNYLTKAQDIFSHLSYVRQAIERGKTIKEIVDGYNGNKGLNFLISEQTYKDINRSVIKITMD